MPAISVTLDGALLARVHTDGLHVLSVHVQATRVDETFAELEMHGGCYPETGESTHLIWISSMPLQPGQLVTVALHDEGDTTRPGKTIEELFPDEPDESTPEDTKSMADVFAEIRRKPLLREGYGLSFVSSTGTSFSGRTQATDHGLGFPVVWNMHQPERARGSLHSYTLDSLEQKLPLNNHVSESIHASDFVQLRVDR